LPGARTISRDPLRDYVCRIVGPALHGVHRNFVERWGDAGGPLRDDDALDTLPPQLARVSSGYRAQIVRTRAAHNDQTVKATYWHAPTFARNYIYLEHQYFFYESWVRRLKEIRADFKAMLKHVGCKAPDEAGTLHLFVVIPQPEDDGMVPRTYDMLKSLGEGQSMPEQDKAMQEAAKAIATGQKSGAGKMNEAIVQSAMQVSVPNKDGDLLVDLAMKVRVARLITVNRGEPLQPDKANVRQVYIHSKLMLIDDSFFTVGSANMNQRSMAADSELNVASDDHAAARKLRRDVWGDLTGNDLVATGQDGEQKRIAFAYDKWSQVMRLNQARAATESLRLKVQGFLVPFEDTRLVSFRHG
jgi:phosphatidylserine/phosphatidylglycerophosphate/cardiolipin synthase-like enzyme